MDNNSSRTFKSYGMSKWSEWVNNSSGRNEIHSNNKSVAAFPNSDRRAVQTVNLTTGKNPTNDAKESSSSRRSSSSMDNGNDNNKTEKKKRKAHQLVSTTSSETSTLPLNHHTGQFIKKSKPSPPPPPSVALNTISAYTTNTAKNSTTYTKKINNTKISKDKCNTDTNDTNTSKSNTSKSNTSKSNTSRSNTSKSNTENTKASTKKMDGIQFQQQCLKPQLSQPMPRKQAVYSKDFFKKIRLPPNPAVPLNYNCWPMQLPNPPPIYKNLKVGDPIVPPLPFLPPQIVHAYRQKFEGGSSHQRLKLQTKTVQMKAPTRKVIAVQKKQTELPKQVSRMEAIRSMDHKRPPNKNNAVEDVQNSETNHNSSEQAALASEIKKTTTDKKNLGDPKWVEKYLELVAFKNKHGRLPTFTDNDLGKWCWDQKFIYNSSSKSSQPNKGLMISNEQYQALVGLGVEFHDDSVDSVEHTKSEEKVDPWEANFQELETFYKENCRFPKTADGKLGNWFNSQRGRFRNLDDLSIKWQERRDRMVKLGVSFDAIHTSKAVQWSEMFRKFELLTKRIGRLPALSDPEPYLEVAIWLGTEQIRLRNEIDFSNDAREQLKKLKNYGFKLEGRKITFKERCKSLLKYRSENGKLPGISESHLGRWLYNIRTSLSRMDDLTEEQISQRECLENIGVEFIDPPSDRGPLKGMKVCISGRLVKNSRKMTRVEAEAFVKAMGGTCVQHIFASTDLLVQGEGSGCKRGFARTYGTKVKCSEDWFNMVDDFKKHRDLECDKPCIKLEEDSE